MRQPIQGYGGRPGLLVRAERLAGKGLEVLGEAPGGELIESSPSQCLRATLLPHSTDCSPEESRHDRPDRPAPVAGIEVREPDGYKAGVPAPLIRVEVRGGPGPPPMSLRRSASTARR